MYIICPKCKIKKSEEAEGCVICEDIARKERVSKIPAHIKQIANSKKLYDKIRVK